jgi:Ca2+-binding RTX toxin-like protein
MVACHSLDLQVLETRVLLAHIGVDWTFGASGLAPVDASVFVSPLAEGKILAVGAAAVSRLTAGGVVDDSFMDAGGAQAALGRMNWVGSTAIVTGERLYVGGSVRSRVAGSAVASDTVFIRAANLSDGSKVDSFGDHGFAALRVPPAEAGTFIADVRLASMSALPDGSVVFTVVQYMHDIATGKDTTMATTMYKIDASGQFDDAFGGTGEVLLRAEKGVDAAFTAVDPQGRILVLHDGDAWSSGVLARFGADGSPDTTFGTNGSVRVFGVGPFVSYEGLRVQPDGKPVVVAENHGDFGNTASVERLTANGTSETSLSLFSSDAAGPFGPAFDDGGQIIVAGGTSLARTTPALQLDPTFDDDGIADLPTGFEAGRVAVDEGGAILVGNARGVARFGPMAPVVLDGNGVIHVESDDRADTLTAAFDGRFINVTLNGETFTFRGSRVTALNVNLRSGGSVVDVALEDVPVNLETLRDNDSIRINSTASVTVNSGGGDDTIVTGSGDDVIRFTGAVSVISGAGDDDVASEGFGSGPLEIDAGDGDDVIDTGEAIALVWGGAGNDVIRDGDRANLGAVFTDRFNGEDGNDTILADWGDDIITGGPGVDSLQGGGGMNTIDGITARGRDSAIFLPGFVRDSGGLLKYQAFPFDEQVSIWADEAAGNLFLWRDGTDNVVELASVTSLLITGDKGNDLFKLNPGLNIPATIDGGAGNDSIYGGAASDSLLGGDGADIVSGRAGDDSIFGGGGNDALRGDAGNDFLEGGAGNDLVVGGIGADRMFGLAGNDRLLSDGDGTRDTVIGGTGSDAGEVDELDSVATVELLS